MPFMGLGLHVLVALYFAVHAIRSGQQMYWLIILFSFPLLGSVVYFFAIYLPNSKMERGAKKTVSAIVNSLDPTRELREAKAAFEYTPTAQNQMRYAKALLEANNAQEAAFNYEACLKGPFANDPEIKLCAARAFFESARYNDCIQHLEAIGSYKPEQTQLLLAKAYAMTGQKELAAEKFKYCANQFGSFESIVEYTIWAIGVNDKNLSEQLLDRLDLIMRNWNRHNKELNAESLKRLQAAKKLMQ